MKMLLFQVKTENICGTEKKKLFGNCPHHEQNLNYQQITAGL